MTGDILSSLNKHFGFTTFRSGQEEAINSLLAGQHTLVVMPIESGKSLIFQLAAMHLTGITLVISPLCADEGSGFPNEGMISVLSYLLGCKNTVNQGKPNQLN